MTKPLPKAKLKATQTKLSLKSWSFPRGLHNPRSHLAPRSTLCLCLRWIQNLSCSKKDKLPTPTWLLNETTQGWLYEARPTVLATTLPQTKNTNHLISTIHSDILASLPPHPLCPSEPRLALRTYHKPKTFHVEIWNLRNLPAGPYAAETLDTAKIFRSTDKTPSLRNQPPLYWP